MEDTVKKQMKVEIGQMRRQMQRMPNEDRMKKRQHENAQRKKRNESKERRQTKRGEGRRRMFEGTMRRMGRCEGHKMILTLVYQGGEDFKEEDN
jgi:hypothetical protein